MAVPVLESFIDPAVEVTTNGSAITIGKPSGTVSGDLLIAFIGTDGNTEFHTSSGWARVEESNTSAGNKTTCVVYFLVAGGSEPSDYTFTGGSNQTRIGTIVRISGQAASGFIDVSGIDNTGDSTTPTSPTVTTTVVDCLVFCFYSQDDEQEGLTHPSGTTEHIDQDNGGGANPGCTIGLASYTQAAAGATGTKAWSGGGTTQWVAMQVAIAPVAAAADDEEFDYMVDNQLPQTEEMVVVAY